MKCIVHYEIDGDTDFFVVEDRDTEKCRLMLNSGVEMRGLTDEKNNIRINVEFENKRSAWFIGIPCWYYVDNDDLRGRSSFYDILLIFVLGLTTFLSWLSKCITGRIIQFPIKVKEIE